MNRLFKMIVVLCITLNCVQLKSQSRLEWQNSFEAFLKRTSIDKMTFIDEYMYCFNNKTYIENYQDEFEFQSKKKEELELLNTNLQDINDSTKYFIVVKASFGDYNFETESFQFKPFDDNTFINFYQQGNYQSSCPTVTKIRLAFINGNDFEGLKIPKEKANNLIKYRKSETGVVDRKVLIKVYFTIDNKVDVKTPTSKNYLVHLNGHISHIIVLDSYGSQYQSGSGDRLALMSK